MSYHDSESTFIFFNGSVLYTCDAGHTVGGFDSLFSSVTRKCGSDGTFSEMSRVHRLLLIQLSGLVVHSSMVKTVLYKCLPALATDPKNKSKTTPQLTSKVDGFVPAVPEVCLPLFFWTGWRSNTLI